MLAKSKLIKKVGCQKYSYLPEVLMQKKVCQKYSCKYLFLCIICQKYSCKKKFARSTTTCQKYSCMH